MSYEIVEVKGKQFAGIKISTTNENQQCIKDMGALWQRFFSEEVMQKAGKTVDYSSYGLYLNYEGDFTKPYDYMACLEVTEPGKDVEVVNMPSGKFAKFSGQGNITEVVGTLWGDIWKTDLKRTYSYDFEKYHYSEDQNNQLIEIYIGIE